MRRTLLAPVLATAIAATSCGLQVQSADLFAVTRTGPGARLTELLSDGGTVRCNGGRQRTLPDPLLLEARDLATKLDADVQKHPHYTAGPNSVYRYQVSLPHGTLRFPDTAAAHSSDLAQLELLTLQTAQQACGLKAS